MCAICYEQEKWDDLLLWALEVEKLAEKQDDSLEWEKDRLCQLAWQALAQYCLGNEAEAYQCYQQAVTKASYAKFILPGSYYKATCAYHEARGDLDKALKMRERQLGELLGKGQIIGEYKCRYEICRLLAKLEQPFEEAVIQARQVAQQLKRPEQYLAKLEMLAHDRI